MGTGLSPVLKHVKISEARDHLTTLDLQLDLIPSRFRDRLNDTITTLGERRWQTRGRTTSEHWQAQPESSTDCRRPFGLKYGDTTNASVWMVWM